MKAMKELIEACEKTLLVWDGYARTMAGTGLGVTIEDRLRAALPKARAEAEQMERAVGAVRNLQYRFACGWMGPEERKLWKRLDALLASLDFPAPPKETP